MPAERMSMRRAREILRLELGGGLSRCTAWPHQFPPLRRT